MKGIHIQFSNNSLLSDLGLRVEIQELVTEFI